MSTPPRAPDTPEGIPDDAFALVGGQPSRPKPARPDDHDRHDDGRRRGVARPPAHDPRPRRTVPDQDAT